MNDEPTLVGADGESALRSAPMTERGLEREAEDSRYVPVILKRTDEALRHPDDTLEVAIAEGLEQLDRSTTSLILSSIAAGMIVGFSAMAVGVVTALTLPLESPLATRIGTALVYPLGFVICVISGAQLFTEHTATAVYPLLDRRARIGQVLRLWLLVVLGNLIGAAAIAFLLTAADEVIGARAGYIELGHHLTHFPPAALLTSSVLAGWLMALGAWLLMSTPPGSEVKLIYMVTFLIGTGGLHHSIAGSVEMFAAMFASGEFTITHALQFISTALVGNVIGGSLFVAVLNYGHIRRTQIAE